MKTLAAIGAKLKAWLEALERALQPTPRLAPQPVRVRVQPRHR